MEAVLLGYKVTNIYEIKQFEKRSPLFRGMSTLWSSGMISDSSLEGRRFDSSQGPLLGLPSAGEWESNSCGFESRQLHFAHSFRLREQMLGGQTACTERLGTESGFQVRHEFADWQVWPTHSSDQFRHLHHQFQTLQKEGAAIQADVEEGD